MDRAGRDREEVALAPLVADAVDLGDAGAGDHVIDRARRLAVRARAHARPQHLQVAADGGDDRAPGDRIEVLHEDVVERVRLARRASQQLGVRRLPAVVPVARGRLGAYRLCLALVGVHREVLEIAHDRRVERVGPDDRLGPLVAVVVPGHARRDDQVAAPHDELVALDGRVGALAVEHEADRAGRVAVGGRHLARQQVQHRDRDRVARRPLRHARIVQSQDPALGSAPRRHELRRAPYQRLDLSPAPDARLHGGGLGPDERPRLQPGRVEPGRRQRRDEIGASGGGGGRPDAHGRQCTPGLTRAGSTASTSPALPRRRAGPAR